MNRYGKITNIKPGFNGLKSIFRQCAEIIGSFASTYPKIDQLDLRWAVYLQ